MRDRQAYFAERWRNLKAEGLCGRCAKEPARPGRTTCASCTAYWRDYHNGVKRALAKRGRCRCGAARRRGKVTCAKCAKYQRLYKALKGLATPSRHQRATPAA